MMHRILLVDDDDNLRAILGHHLQQAGYAVEAVGDGREALRHLTRSRVDLLVTDVRMPEMGGLALLREVRAADPDLPVVVMTAFGTIQDAVEAVRSGAFDYLTKPVDRETLLRVAMKALHVGALQRENRNLRDSLQARAPLDSLLGTSPALQEVKSMLRRAAPADVTVLLTGESGTGKELAARSLHALSARAGGPFVAINCAALPPDLLESELFGHVKGAFTGAVSDREGKFRQAGKGTLFLDEVGDMELRLQAKLLRALQERVVDPVGAARSVPIDVRVVAATNRDLKGLVREGRFREDLYFRLAVLQIGMPPLRECRADIPLLMVESYRRAGGGELTLEPEALRRIENHSWPGNVRELQNLCQRLAVLHPREPVSEAMLRAELEISPSPLAPEEPRGLWDVERETIREALRKARGNKSGAARALRIPRHVLLYRLKKFGIDG